MGIQDLKKCYKCDEYIAGFCGVKQSPVDGLSVCHAYSSKREGSQSGYSVLAKRLKK